MTQVEFPVFEDLQSPLSAHDAIAAADLFCTGDPLADELEDMSRFACAVVQPCSEPTPVVPSDRAKPDSVDEAWAKVCPNNKTMDTGSPSALFYDRSTNENPIPFASVPMTVNERLALADANKLATDQDRSNSATPFDPYLSVPATVVSEKSETATLIFATRTHSPTADVTIPSASPASEASLQVSPRPEGDVASGETKSRSSTKITTDPDVYPDTDSVPNGPVASQGRALIDREIAVLPLSETQDADDPRIRERLDSMSSGLVKSTELALPDAETSVSRPRETASAKPILDDRRGYFHVNSDSNGLVRSSEPASYEKETSGLLRRIVPWATEPRLHAQPNSASDERVKPSELERETGFLPLRVTANAIKPRVQPLLDSESKGLFRIQDPALIEKEVKVLGLRQTNSGDERAASALGVTKPDGVTVANRVEFHAPARPSAADQIADQMLTRLEIDRQSRQTFFTIRLDPPELGTIRVRLAMSENTITAHLMAADSATCQLLENLMPTLRTKLSDSGLALGTFDVTQGREDFDTESRRKRQGGRSGSSSSDHQAAAVGRSFTRTVARGMIDVLA